MRDYSSRRIAPLPSEVFGEGLAMGRNVRHSLCAPKQTGSCSSPRLVVVNCAAVVSIQGDDEQFVVVNIEDYPVVTSAISPQTLEWPA